MNDGYKKSDHAILEHQSDINLFLSVGQHYWGINKSKDSMGTLESIEIMERGSRIHKNTQVCMSKEKSAYCIIYPRARAGIEIL